MYSPLAYRVSYHNGVWPLRLKLTVSVLPAVTGFADAFTQFVRCGRERVAADTMDGEPINHDSAPAVAGGTVVGSTPASIGALPTTAPAWSRRDGILRGVAARDDDGHHFPHGVLLSG